MMAKHELGDSRLGLSYMDERREVGERVTGGEVGATSPSVVCDTSCRASVQKGGLDSDQNDVLGGPNTPNIHAQVTLPADEDEQVFKTPELQPNFRRGEVDVSVDDKVIREASNPPTVSVIANKTKLTQAKPLRVFCDREIMEKTSYEEFSQSGQFGSPMPGQNEAENSQSTNCETKYLLEVAMESDKAGSDVHKGGSPTNVVCTTVESDMAEGAEVCPGGRSQVTQEEREASASSRLAIPLLSPGVDSNHDSCYDSDVSSTGGSRRNSSQHLETEHSDVSRTTSDTLGAEHVEDCVQEKTDVVQDLRNVTLQSVIQDGYLEDKLSMPETEHKNMPGEDCGESDTNAIGDANNGDLMGIPDYASKVEFALKLGYSEEQVRAVLAQKGCDVNQNELLSELIKAGRTGNQISDGSDDEMDVVEDSNHQYVAIPDASNIPKPLSDESCPTQSQLGQRLVSETSDVSNSVPKDNDSNLRPIVIDGSNVAMSHGNKEVFSCKGIQIAVDWFKQRGHKDIVVFVPQWRKESPRADTPIADQEILDELEREKILVYTPARRVGGKRIVCYDDRFIIKLAAENSGIVVSNDNYRDLVTESEDYRKVVETRLLMYSIVNDRFMPPEDPLGKYGPRLDNFLQKEPTVPDPTPPVCPYGKKCTYGNKCKYYHPERGANPHKSVTDRLMEQARIKIKEVKQRGIYAQDGRKDPSPVRKAPLSKTKSLAPANKTPLSRTKSLQPGMGLGLESGLPFSLPGELVAPNKEESVQDRSDRESPIKVSITTAEDSKKYNAKLAEYVQRMEQAEKEAQSGGSSQRQIPSHGLKPAQGHSGSQESLKPPGHWYLAHENLRPVHSDPNHYEGSLASGHLSLAKKLSDEGSDMGRRSPHLSPAQSELQLQRDIEQAKIQAEREKLNQRLQELQVAENNIEREKNLYNRPHAQVSGTQSVGMNGHNQHKKLARQLSLQGREDPRLQQTAPANKPLPGVRFHGPPVPKPQPPMVIMAGEQWGSNSSLNNEVFYDGAGPHHANIRTYNPHQPLLRQATVGGEMGMSCPNHNPVQRIPSAPVTQHSGAGPPAPTMTRQNSTSDPQLNLASEDIVSALQGQSQYPGGPCESRSVWAYKFQQMHPHLMSAPQLPPSQPSVSGVKVAFGQGPSQRQMSQHYPQAQIQRQFYPPQRPFSPQPMASGNNVAAPQVQRLHNASPTPLQNLLPGYPAPNMEQVGQAFSCGRNMQGSPGGQFYMPSQANFDAIHTSIASSNLYSPQQMLPPSLPADLPGGQGSTDTAGPRSKQSMDHISFMQMNAMQYHDNLQAGSHRSNSPMSQQEILPQQYDNQPDPLLLSDSRHQHIYAHLCALFPEADVHAVVHRFPNETDPKKLCAYIMKPK